MNANASSVLSCLVNAAGGDVGGYGEGGGDEEVCHREMEL